MRENIITSKNGFTMVELLISISILGIITLVTSSVFAVSLKSYRQNIQKSFFQKDINIAIDTIAKNIKSASEAISSYDTYPGSGHNTADTLILEVPAKNSDEEFVYTANVLEKDYIVYYLDGENLHKKIYGNSKGILAGQNGDDSIILNYVESFNVQYSPSVDNANTVTVSATLSRSNGRGDTKVTQSRTAGLRNKQ